MKFIIHMHVKKNQPILVRVLQAYQTFLIFTWNFVNRLKQTFLQITFLLLADTEPIKTQRRLIDVSKTEKRVRFLASCGSHIVKFLIHDGLFVRPQAQRERNVVRFSVAVSGKERCLTTLKTAVQQTSFPGAIGNSNKALDDCNHIWSSAPSFIDQFY